MNKPRYTQNIITVIKNNPLLTAQEIHGKLPNIDLVTVYRNLKGLVKKGTIRELSIKKGESVYEYVTDEHQHALCKKCGQIHHIEVDKKKLITALDLKSFVLDDIEINIKGYCK